MRILGSFSVLVGLSAASLAQTVARDVRPPADPGPTAEGPPPAHPPAGLGANLGIGWAGDGWLARLEYDVLPVMAPDGQAGPVFGFAPGFEFWRHEPDWGFAIPLAVIGGIRIQPVRATIGFGFDGLLVDVVDDDTGVGLWAPFGCASVDQALGRVDVPARGAADDGGLRAREPGLVPRGSAARAREGCYTVARRAFMIFTNDLLRISSSDRPVASASCSVTAPHAIPRRK